MNTFGLINLGIFPLLLEAMTPAYAQHDQREQESRRPNQEQQAKPERQQAPPNPGKQPQQVKPAGQEAPRRSKEPAPNRRPQPTSPAHPEEPQRARGQQERQQQNVKAQQEQKQRPPQVKGQQDQKQKQEQPRQQQAKQPVQQVQREYENRHRGAWLDRRANNWQAEHRSWQQRGGYTGYRIPDARYRGFFGPSHSFRMFSFPLLVVGGFPRFQYGGLWFSVIDPWPEYWSNNWYDSDDLYVEFYGGGYYLRNRMHPRDRIALTVFIN